MRIEPFPNIKFQSTLKEHPELQKRWPIKEERRGYECDYWNCREFVKELPSNWQMIEDFREYNGNKWKMRERHYCKEHEIKPS